MTYVMAEWSGGGGIGHYSFLLADGLARQGISTTLATRRGHELAALPHVHRIATLWPAAPIRLRGRIRRIVIGLGWFWGWLRVIVLVSRHRHERDLVVHVHAPESVPELVFLAALRLLSPCLLITAHNAVPHDSVKRGGLMHRLTYRLPHGIVSQSEAEAETVRAIAGRRPQITVIPHGSYVPIADWPATHTRNDHSTITIAHLGSIRPYKGFDLVVEAFRRAHARDDRLRLRVVGRAANEEQTRALLETLADSDWSCSLGYATVEQLVQEARSADIAVLGHRRASESGILHLMLATGTPVIGPDIAGIGRLLAAEPSWLYRANDPIDAARALSAIAATLPEGREEARRRARSIAERGAPSWDEVAIAHIEFIAQRPR